MATLLLTKACTLGDLLTPISRIESLQPEKIYRFLGVRLHGAGSFIREIKPGKESAATKLYQVKEGDFIYSRLYGWQGAFGVIPHEQDGCYVSNEFPIYRANENLLNARYLAYWFRQPSVLHKIKMDCSGSTPGTRNRFKERFFEALEIEVPLLSDQLRIVAHIDAVAEMLKAYRLEAKAYEDELIALLNKAFWQIAKGAPYLPMSEVAPLVRRPVEINSDASYLELGVRSFGKGTFHKPPLPGIEVGSKKLFRIEPRDLVFNIVFAWEGAVAIAQDIDEGRVGSHRFLTCVCRTDVAIPEYLNFYFKTVEGLQRIGEASPGGAGRNRTLGLKALEGIKVPVPDYKQQQAFCALLNQARLARQLRTLIESDLASLLPAMLHQAFGNGDEGQTEVLL